MMNLIKFFIIIILIQCVTSEDAGPFEEPDGTIVEPLENATPAVDTPGETGDSSTAATTADTNVTNETGTPADTGSSINSTRADTQPPAPAPTKIQSQPQPKTKENMKMEMPENDNPNTIKPCTKEIQCKQACGKPLSDSQCNTESGNCLCIRARGPPPRCRNIGHGHEHCASICRKKIAQICRTDCGSYCSCFVRN